MRNGPLVRDHSKPARPSPDGPLPPLKLLSSSRGVATARLPEGRPPAGPPSATLSDTACVRLDSSLPLNLRSFLLEELGPWVRIENDAIYSQYPGQGENFIRELARAIRRFSFNRSRENWIECRVSIAALEAMLRSALESAGTVTLCLSCAHLSASHDGHGEPGRHSDGSCVAMAVRPDLIGAVEDSTNRTRAFISHGLYEVIEGFRRSRAAADRDHFDLDYYLQNGAVVFTWRPVLGRSKAS